MSTPKEIFEQKLPQKLEANKDKISAINAIYEFNLSGDQGGTWSIDLTGGGAKVVAGSTAKANCTITMSDENFTKLIEGELNAQMAFMTGKLKVSGDMGLALKLGSILG